MDHARATAKQFAGAALYEVTHAYGGLPESDDKSFILQVIRYMVSRDL
jgi:hypothetical protein